MQKVYFRSEQEVIYFCEILYQVQDEIQLGWKKDTYWGNELQLNEELPPQTLLLCFVEVFLSFRLRKMIAHIIRHTYHFTEVAEIEQICTLTDWVLTEPSYVGRLFHRKGSNEEDFMEHWNRATFLKERSIHKQGEEEFFPQKQLRRFIFVQLMQHMDNQRLLHFDSLITFCMKPLHELLITAVGYAIDEMKREEEHQNYVQSLREFIVRRQPKCDLLHIVQGEPFQFYQANGKKYSTLELKALMHREPLYLVGLDENELNLSPVLTLLPKKIYMYGDHPAEAKTLTLINLFQERVQFFPTSQFPFAFT